VPLDWDIDPRDWARPGTSWIVYAMLAAQPGDIILCHDGGGDRSQTYAALKTVIPQLRARGLKFVTLPAHREVADTR
jgi:peptidoglycan/xylan/chitin deacetylase (PgdA/CDA1 family)